MSAAPTGAVDDPFPRQAARVVLIDAESRVLLLHGFDPGRPDVRYWITIGGGIDPGETSAQAAARELFEETGLMVEPELLGQRVWRQTTQFPFDGRWYRQDQDFYQLRIESWEIAPETAATLLAESVDEHRWWTLAELAGTTERYYPDELIALLSGILES